MHAQDSRAVLAPTGDRESALPQRARDAGFCEGASGDVVDHAFAGRPTGQNYGCDMAYNAGGTNEIAWNGNTLGDPACCSSTGFAVSFH